MNRRDFLKSTAVIATAGSLQNVMATPSDNTQSANIDNSVTEESGKLITSAPMLQNYAETSMGVAFSVSHLANGFVVYGEKADLSDGKTVMCGGFRVMDVNEHVMQIRLTGLKPATKYYYQIGAHRIHYKHYHNKKILGTEKDPQIYSFTTAGADAKAHFCVINDTHSAWIPFGLSLDKIAEINPSCVIWNGDVPTNTAEKIEDIEGIFLRPQIERLDYAAQIPYMFCPGNHDDRGWASRQMEKVWMFRQPDERNSKFWDLGRNFAVRMGDVAMIGLDTAEDKVDSNPRFIGIYNSEAYREAQAVWLQDALKAPEIANAPYIVAFCHIPLFDPRPNSNPGDVQPNDKDPRYSTDFAAWQRTCANLWMPILQQAGCELVITGHQHQYRYDAPTADRKWTQIVGGGPHMGVHEKNGVKRDAPSLFPTVIEGKVEKKKLKITIHNIVTGKVQDTFYFSPRKK